MSKIPPELLAEILLDPYYRVCCMKGLDNIPCAGRIEFHHNLIFAGSQFQSKFCILPLCKEHHIQADFSDVKEHLDWIMLSRASDFQIKLISKALNYQQRLDYLNKKYGYYIPPFLGTFKKKLETDNIQQRKDDGDSKQSSQVVAPGTDVAVEIPTRFSDKVASGNNDDFGGTR